MNHIIKDHNYRKAYLSSHPLIHSFPSTQLINATELCHISNIPCLRVKAKLHELNINSSTLHGGAGGSYVTYENGFRLCEVINLDGLSVYYAGEPQGQGHRWGQLHTTHEQLFVHHKIMLPKNLDTVVPEQLPQSEALELREFSDTAAGSTHHCGRS